MTDVFVSSREKANNGYGQNGYQGASSDLPGENTTSGFLPAVTLPAAKSDKVDATPIAAHPGMKARDSKSTFPTSNVHPVTKRALGGNFQR